MGNKKGRLILGGILSPLAAPALFFLVMTFGSGYTMQGPGHVEKLVRLTLGFVAESYVISLIFGVPTVLILNKLGRLTASNLVLSSFVAGTVAGVGFGILIYWPNVSENVATDLVFGAIGAMSGLLISVSFCFLAGIFRRAQKEEKQ